ncbi:MAG: hypothetical protein IIA45_02035 [Bacteroidetes bacterium]|nr:hypothetical protein [Bacteroidota bacterium]
MKHRKPNKPYKRKKNHSSVFYSSDFEHKFASSKYGKSYIKNSYYTDMEAQKIIELLNNDILGKRSKFIIYIHDKKSHLYEYRLLLNLDRFLNAVNSGLDKVYLAALFGKLNELSAKQKSGILSELESLNHYGDRIFFKKGDPAYVLTDLAKYMNAGINVIKTIEKHPEKLGTKYTQMESPQKFGLHLDYYN